MEDVSLQLVAVNDIRDFLYINDSWYATIDTKKALENAPQHTEYIVQIDSELQLSYSMLQNDENSSSFAAVSSCVGENDWGDTLFSEKVLVDSCVANQIVGLVTMAASVATVAAVIMAAVFPPAALGTAVAAAILAFNAGYIAYHAAQGCGIKVHRLFGFFPWKAESQF